jgi:hypothetical protein
VVVYTDFEGVEQRYVVVWTLKRTSAARQSCESDLQGSHDHRRLQEERADTVAVDLLDSLLVILR